MKKVAVIVPYHKKDLGDFDKISVTQLCKVLGAYPIIFVCPQYIDPRDSVTMVNSEIIFLDKIFFESHDGYNGLLLSSFFYSQFLDYEYILVAQTDSFVFKDNLVSWCDHGYDFVGAPWTFELSNYPYLRPQLPLRHRHRFLKSLRRLSKNEFLVGNGGFSLRKVKTLWHFAKHYENRISQYKKFMLEWKNIGKAETHYEDNFWSLYAPAIDPDFKIPNFRVALEFAFEVNPAYCYLRNGNKLPFGCHAWMKHDLDFWKPIISSFGYNLPEISAKLGFE